MHDEPFLRVCIQGHCLHPIHDTEKKLEKTEKSRAGSKIDRMMPTQEASGKTDKRITGKMD